jgi:hypothetical protein
MHYLNESDLNPMMSHFDQIKAGLNRSPENGPAVERRKATRASGGGSFDRIKQRLNIHKANEVKLAENVLLQESLTPVACERSSNNVSSGEDEANTGTISPNPMENDILVASSSPDFPSEILESDFIPEAGVLPAQENGVYTTMPSPNAANAPFATAQSPELSLDDALSMSSAQTRDVGYAPELDMELQESHAALTQAQKSYASSSSAEYSAAPLVMAEPRRVPQLSLDNLNESQPSNGADYTSNVKTLIKLINELPDGVTKQTGAQIIRFTMEAMGIAMEEVLSEAQSTQSEMLDAVRGNIKKIEEYKTVIRKLESDIKFYQGKANELSEIIDLFILSSSSLKSSNELGM